MNNDLEKLYQKKLQERNNIMKKNIISNDRNIDLMNDKINKLKKENFKNNQLNILFEKKLKDREMKKFKNNKHLDFLFPSKIEPKKFKINLIEDFKKIDPRPLYQQKIIKNNNFIEKNIKEKNIEKKDKNIEELKKLGILNF